MSVQQPQQFTCLCKVSRILNTMHLFIHEYFKTLAFRFLTVMLWFSPVAAVVEVRSSKQAVWWTEIANIEERNSCLEPTGQRLGQTGNLR